MKTSDVMVVPSQSQIVKLDKVEKQNGDTEFAGIIASILSSFIGITFFAGALGLSSVQDLPALAIMCLHVAGVTGVTAAIMLVVVLIENLPYPEPPKPVQINIKGKTVRESESGHKFLCSSVSQGIRLSR